MDNWGRASCHDRLCTQRSATRSDRDDPLNLSGTDMLAVTDDHLSLQHCLDANFFLWRLLLKGKNNNTWPQLNRTSTVRSRVSDGAMAEKGVKFRWGAFQRAEGNATMTQLQSFLCMFTCEQDPLNTVKLTPE